MQQLTTRNANQILFAAPERGRIAARIVLLLAVAVVAASIVAPDTLSLEPSQRWLVGGAIGIACLACAGALAWRDALSIDTGVGAVRRRIGLWPLLRTWTAPLAELHELALLAARGNDAAPKERLTLRLAVGRHTVTLFRNRCDAAAVREAEDLARSLGVPLVHRSAIDQRRTRRARAAAARAATVALAWVGLLAVFTLMLWPTITRRPSSRDRVEAAVRDAGTDAYNTAWDAYNAGHYADSERQFAAFLSAHPASALGYNMLAYAQAGQGHLDDAMGSAEHALALAPQNGAIIDTVGEMHERRGDLRVAASYYARALEQEQSYEAEETHAKYGRTLMGLHDWSRAADQLEAARATRTGLYSMLAAKLLKQLAGQGRLAHRPLGPPAPRARTRRGGPVRVPLWLPGGAAVAPQ